MTRFAIDTTSEEFLEESNCAMQTAFAEGIDLTQQHPKYSVAYELQEELELKSHELTSLLLFDILEGDSLESLSEKDSQLVNQVLYAVKAGSNTPRIHYTKEHKTQGLINICHALSIRRYTLPKEYQAYLNAPHSRFPSHVKI